MRDRSPPENTARVVTLALSFFGAFALLGHAGGVFERLDAEVVVALAVFAVGYAIAAALLDPGLRAWILERVRGPTKAPAKSPARSPAAT